MLKPGDTLVAKKMQPPSSGFLYTADGKTETYFNAEPGALLIYLGNGPTRWPATMMGDQKKHVVGQFLCKGRFFETTDAKSTTRELFSLILGYMEPVGD